MKKFIGIFYKSWWLWLHYVPLTLAVWAIFHGIFRLFVPVHQWYLVSGIWFNTVLIFALYIGASVIDQLVHALLDLVGVKD